MLLPKPFAKLHKKGVPNILFDPADIFKEEDEIKSFRTPRGPDSGQYSGKSAAKPEAKSKAKTKRQAAVDVKGQPLLATPFGTIGATPVKNKQLLAGD